MRESRDSYANTTECTATQKLTNLGRGLNRGPRVSRGIYHMTVNTYTYTHMPMHMHTHTHMYLNRVEKELE